MNFGRILANALARRIAYVLVAALLAGVGIGSARAAAPCNNQNQCSRAEALAECQSYSGMVPGGTCTINIPARQYLCRWPTSNGRTQLCGPRYIFYWQGETCANGGVFNDLTGECQKPCTNAAWSPVTFHSVPLNGSTSCLDGCVWSHSQNGDTTSTATVTGAMCRPYDYRNNCPSGSHWNDYMMVCEPQVKECPAGQKEENGQCVPDGKCPEGMIAVQGSTPGAVQQGSLYCKPKADECPHGTIKAPATGKCIPGEGQCAAGEARRENGTCGKDSDGDGKADEDDDNPDNDPEKESASGGDSCDVPPSCSGGAIACLQVKVQWRIDCNTRKVKNISGGTCDAVPVCTGKDCDAMQYAQLMQQWRATCALEKMAKKGTSEEGSDGSDANGNGVPDALEGTGEVSEVGDGAADIEASRKFGVSLSPSMLDRDNFFGGGSCPQPPTFKMMGATISGADFPYWCQAMSILRSLILIFGTYYALRILLGGSF